MVQRSFRLGGVKGERSKERVEDTLNLIDGVRQATLNEQASELSIDFDNNVVHQDHLTSTLNSLGYSILGDRDNQGEK